MPVLRVRDLVYLARNGAPVNVAGWEYTLDALYADTQPSEWTPLLGSREAWQADTYEIDRLAAERIAAHYNDLKPWDGASAATPAGEDDGSDADGSEETGGS